MDERLEQLEAWVFTTRSSTLPELQRRVTAMSHGSAHKLALRTEIALMQRILEDHDQLRRDQLEHAARMQLFDSVHDGIQQCGRHCIDRDDNAALQTCLLVLAEIDFHLRLLRAVT